METKFLREMWSKYIQRVRARARAHTHTHTHIYIHTYTHAHKHTEKYVKPASFSSTVRTQYADNEREREQIFTRLKASFIQKS